MKRKDNCRRGHPRPIPMSRSLLARVVAEASSLPEPENYRVGLKIDPPALPNEILLFLRVNRPEGEWTHHRHVLLFCLEKKLEAVLNNEVVPVGEGEVLLIFPYQTHRYQGCDESVKVLFLSFAAETYAHLLPLRNRPVLLKEDDVRLLREIMACYRAFASDRRCAADGVWIGMAVGFLLSTLARRVAAAGVLPQVTTLDELRVFEKVNKIIHERIAENLSVEELAAKLGVSVSGLSKLARRELGGLSIGRYVRRIRINKAASLLAEGNMGVREAAQSCGFNSIQAFSRCFKRETGLLPSSYKKAETRSGDAQRRSTDL